MSVTSCAWCAGTPERVQVLLAAAQTPMLSDPVWGSRILSQLCIVILRLSSQARQVLATDLHADFSI